MKMKSHMEATATAATLDLRGTYSANELEALITELATLRSGMQPPVPQNRPNPLNDPDKPILMESDSAMTAALRTDGSFRLWLRNRGTGWMGYEVDAQRAQALAQYILSRSDGRAIDLISHSDSKRH